MRVGIMINSVCRASGWMVRMDMIHFFSFIMATQFSVIEGLHLGKILLWWMLYLIVFAIFFIKIREQSLATKLIVTFNYNLTQ